MPISTLYRFLCHYYLNRRASKSQRRRRVIRRIKLIFLFRIQVINQIYQRGKVNSVGAELTDVSIDSAPRRIGRRSRLTRRPRSDDQQAA